MARLADLINTGIDLFQSVRNLGYERGRTNIVLNHMGPLEEMADNRAFVAQRRQEGDEALGRALAAVARLAPGQHSTILDNLRLARENLVRLRPRADELMILPGAERDQGFPPVWFATASKQILHVRQLLEEFCAEISRMDGTSASIAQLMLTSLALRDEAAPEIALMSGIMVSGQPMSKEAYLRILISRGRVQQFWEQMRQAAVVLGSAEVIDRVEQFHVLYFDRYMPLGAQVLERAREGGPYPLPQKEFLDIGVVPIEYLVATMRAIAETGSRHAGTIRDSAREKFVLQLTLLGLGLLLVATLVVGVASRLITPLTRLAQVTRGVAERELTQDIPYLGRGDEVGALARAVDVLKGNTVAMIEDVAALRQSKRSLQQALDEVSTLSGLLPICANCKKIRDDQGYWQAIEKYIGKRSQAKFSHGICPDCVKKLYPEYANQLLDDKENR